MDSNSLYYSLELVAGSGCTLNVEQRTALQTSLVILKKNYKFHRVLFWGKILGLKDHYFIAQGRGEDEMKDKKNLYSFNCIDWFLLPPATESMIDEVSRAAKTRFIGDPSYVYEHLEIRRRGGDEAEEEEVWTKVSEESRLAVTVHKIDEEVSVVPRGAFVKSPHGLVQINRSFGGLSHSEAGKLDNFLHFSEPKNLRKKSILEMGKLNPAIDFLDVLSDDIPKGSWSLQFECASKVRVLRSVLWLGLTFYHVPMTPQHGYIYIGDGTKNLDLPFML
ncbi:radial spoke head protein 9 homolog [Seriola lalandi dorsalis]|uniref:Radial spoke head protein 9 homolog n=1 Tax=Seriola lalandi dorsalis TaxID=1841481 RepID=A0A3B4YRX2_SERLL|nr:radial spoke head protein 9 homolog [Seriola lalandi dorsalis]XP_056261072.1 radial spoke head protein 9 homolog isoform X1 [Seriola aureovittata]